MRRGPIPRVVSALLVAVGAFAPSASGQRPVEDPMDVFRRQAREEQRKRQAFFDALAALPEPAVPLPVVRDRFLLEIEEVEGDDEGPMAEVGPDRDPRPRAGEAAVGRNRRQALARENFDLHVFGDEASEEARRGRLDAMLAEKIERAARTHRLTPAQREKLRLAGRGDVKRLFDRIEESRREFDRVRSDLRAGVAFLRGLAPERLAYVAGPFGSDSIYRKSLTRILTEPRSGSPR